MRRTEQAADDKQKKLILARRRPVIPQVQAVDWRLQTESLIDMNGPGQVS
jgi:hypothetical protein